MNKETEKGTQKRQRFDLHKGETKPKQVFFKFLGKANLVSLFLTAAFSGDLVVSMGVFLGSWGKSRLEHQNHCHPLSPPGLLHFHMPPHCLKHSPSVESICTYSAAAWQVQGNQMRFLACENGAWVLPVVLNTVNSYGGILYVVWSIQTFSRLSSGSQAMLWIDSHLLFMPTRDSNQA